MSRPQERSNRAHLAVVPSRSARANILGLRRRLGHAAVLGGVEYVERLAYSDEVVGIFLELDAKARKEAMGLIANVTAQTRKKPPVAKAPCRDSRVKVRWTDEFTARFQREAPKAKTDIELCGRLGLPSYCRGAMRAARSRHGIRYAAATRQKTSGKGAPTAFALPLAA